MKIANDSVVTLHYKLHDDKGEHIDSSGENEPLVYLHGGGELIDGLETALNDKSAGEQFAVTVPPEQAYGEEDPELVRVFHIDDFNGVEMREGMELQGKDPEGNFRLLRVVKVAGDDVTVNMNHPLAGMTLVFDISIESVRPATDTEIAHGHVHGDGHEHH